MRLIGNPKKSSPPNGRAIKRRTFFLRLPLEEASIRKENIICGYVHKALTFFPVTKGTPEQKTHFLFAYQYGLKRMI